MDPETIIDQAISELAGHLQGRANAPGLLRRLFDGLCEKLSKDLSVDHISAPNLVVEVLDTESGRLFRRYLELEFDENDNGIRLIGENMAGEAAQLVFLSGTALRKMRDIRGCGRDTPRCKEDA
ncbi:MAG: hypothetical protein LBK05_02980 [Treponema sp.]|jgi:hypothetical protein|nr:hypothetical protein [Treponema sp.]